MHKSLTTMLDPALQLIVDQLDTRIGLTKFKNATQFNDLRKAIDQLFQKRVDAETAIKRQKDAARNEKRKRSEAIRAQVINLWAPKYLQPGMIVKFAGASRGGLREVLRVDSYEIVAYQGRLARKDGKVEFVRDDIITTHIFDKVRKVLVDGVWKDAHKIAMGAQ